MSEFEKYNDGLVIDHGNGITETHIAGIIIWTKNGSIHRDDDKPAFISQAEQSWFQNGKLHRSNAPAVMYSNGEEVWYIDDESLSKSQINSIKLKLELDQNLNNNSSTLKKHKL